MGKWDVFWELTKTDFKLKYAGTVLGFIWSLLKPLSMLGVLYLVFAYFFENNIESYSLFLLIGILVWTYFVDATTNSIISITNNKQILTKTNLSPSIIIFSACTHSFISFILSFVAFIIIFLIIGKSFTLLALIFIPLVAILFIITSSISHILIILSAKFTDFKHIWDIIVQIGFWITPIIYSIHAVPNKYQRLIWINPIAQIIEHSRNALIYNTPINLWQISILLFITISIVLIAMRIYKKNKTIIVDKL